MTNVAQREALLPTRTEAERVLCQMPLFHSYAMAMGLYLAAYAPRARGAAAPPAAGGARSDAQRITIFGQSDDLRS
jgi:hypothetical protein